MILDEYRITQLKVGTGWQFRVTAPEGVPTFVGPYDREAQAIHAAATHYADRMVTQAIVAKRDPAYGPKKGHPDYFDEAMARFSAA